VKKRNLIAVPGAVLLLNAVPATAATYYSITSIQAVELGTMGGGNESVANDINDRGEIVGWATNLIHNRRAFLYRNGAMQDISFGTTTVTEARGINNLTQVVGNFRQNATDAPHAFYWDDFQQFELLDEAYPQGSTFCATGADAAAINDAGVITGTQFVGCAQVYPEWPIPVRWPSWSSVLNQISRPLSDGVGRDINSVGDIAALAMEPGNIREGFVWRGGIYSSVPLPQAPTPVYPDTIEIHGMNDRGVVVGEVFAGGYRAIMWNGSSTFPTLLPVLMTTGHTAAYEINNQGFIVGKSRGSTKAARGVKNLAAIWHADIGITLMPVPQGSEETTENCEALSVNNRSSSKATDALVQAVGFCLVNGERRAMLWNINTRISKGR
jgi:probable HAF family extracellular repeat protein